MKYIIASMFLFAFLLQIATLKHPALKYCEMAKAGKRILAAGLLIGAIVMVAYDPNNLPVYSGALSLFLIMLGLIFTVSERLIHHDDTPAGKRKGDNMPKHLKGHNQ